MCYLHMPSAKFMVRVFFLHLCNLSNGCCWWQLCFLQLNLHISHADEEVWEWPAYDIWSWTSASCLDICTEALCNGSAFNGPNGKFCLNYQHLTCSKIKCVVGVVLWLITCECYTYTPSCTLVFLTQVQIVALLLWSFIALMTRDAGWNTIRFNFCPVDLYRPSSYVLLSNGKRQRFDSLSAAQCMCIRIVDFRPM